MSRFDEADKRASGAVDRAFGTVGVTLRPKRRSTGSTYTDDGEGSFDDSSRPILTDLVGVLTLRPTTTRNDGDRMGGDFVGMFANSEAVISFARSQFPPGQMPQRGDRIDLPAPVEGLQYFEAGRPQADGSARIVVPLSSVSP